jgi:endonuclease/exonuclease/phosphatase (EEP) superfamily protein YafD
MPARSGSSRHLDDPADAGNIRLEQVEQLIEFRDELTPAIVAGDLNATPDSDVLAALTGSGLFDAGATLGPDATTSEDGRRIDYILATADLPLIEVHIVDTDASDHDAVVATYDLDPVAGVP